MARKVWIAFGSILFLYVSYSTFIDAPSPARLAAGGQEAPLAGRTTFYVPDNYATIQEAIDAVVNGDTVIVRAGSYLENITFRGKNIEVKSEAGPQHTAIDGNLRGTVVSFHAGEGPGAILDGFSVSNGKGSGGFLDEFGGGIYISDSSPTVRNCIVSGNTARDAGGGICCVSSAAIIEYNIIRNNVLTSFSTGAGIYCYESSATITGNIISNNSADEGAAGIYCKDSSPAIINNIIAGNSAGRFGGGICCSGSSSPVIAFNTITGNSSSLGGGIYCGFHASPTIVNCILWNNTAPPGAGAEIHLHDYFPTTLDIDYCDVGGGLTSVYEGPSATLNWGSHMLDSDPLFAESGAGDFHLTFGSPCRDVADVSIPGLPPFDFEGDPRVVNNRADLGADQFYFHLYSMDDGPSPAADIDIRIVGGPGMAATIGTGTLQDPPQQTPFGDLYLAPPIKTLPAGTIPGTGVLILSLNVDSGLDMRALEIYPVQALVGAPGVPGTTLTNLLMLEVER